MVAAAFRRQAADRCDRVPAARRDDQPVEISLRMADTSAAHSRRSARVPRRSGTLGWRRASGRSVPLVADDRGAPRRADHAPQVNVPMSIPVPALPPPPPSPPEPLTFPSFSFCRGEEQTARQTAMMRPRHCLPALNVAQMVSNSLRQTACVTNTSVDRCCSISSTRRLKLRPTFSGRDRSQGRACTFHSKDRVCACVRGRQSPAPGRALTVRKGGVGGNPRSL